MRKIYKMGEDGMMQTAWIGQGAQVPQGWFADYQAAFETWQASQPTEPEPDLEPDAESEPGPDAEEIPEQDEEPEPEPEADDFAASDHEEEPEEEAGEDHEPEPEDEPETEEEEDNGVQEEEQWTEGQVSLDDLEDMTKNQLEAYAKEKFGVDLDKRKKRETLLDEVLSLMAESE